MATASKRLSKILTAYQEDLVLGRREAIQFRESMEDSGWMWKYDEATSETLKKRFVRFVDIAYATYLAQERLKPLTDQDLRVAWERSGR